MQIRLYHVDLRLELEQLATSDETADIYSPLLEMVQVGIEYLSGHQYRKFQYQFYVLL
jgi:hypothetical protein